ncbi:MAG: CARDB domain-containing protein, partial [Methylocella sp.]
VTPSPLAPVAVDETATTPAGVPVPIDLTAGATGKPTSAALVGTPVGGKVTGFPATTVTFTPTTGFTGAASFQFMLANAFGKSNTATTTITVKGPDPNFKLSASAYCNTSPPTGPAVKLGWTAQSGAASYDLYRNGQLYSQSIPQTSFDNNANVTAGNTYAYFVVAHASGREIESNVVSVLVPSGTCSAAALPNLVIQNLLLSGNSVAAGSNAQIKFTVHNKTPYTTVGAGSAAPSVTHIRLGKSSSKVTANDSLLLSLSTPASAAEADPNRGDSVEVAEQVTIPNNLAAGPYYLWVILDSTSSAGQGRANELDDKSALPITVTNPVVGPDLVVRNLALNHAKIAPGASITVSFSVANQGSNTANASSTKVYLSTSNSHIGPADLLLGSMTTPSVGPGLALPKTASTFTIPAQTPAGDYYAWVMLDANNSAGQPPVAKANDKAYVPLSLASDAAKAAGPMPLALAADAAPVPVRLVKAVQRTLHALKALAITGSPKLPDTLNTVKSLAGILIAAGEDLHFLNTKEDALASLEYLRSIDNDLNSEINALEQGVNAYRPTKLGALVAE